MAFGNDRLGRLRVQLDASMGPLERKLKDAESKLMRAGDKLGQGWGRALVIGMRVGLAGVASAAAVFVANSKATIEWADSLRIASDRLGLTTSQLQLLRTAAALSNAEINQLEMGFQRFTRRTGEAQQGRGEALPAFNRLGINVFDESGKRRSSFDVFRETISALDKIDDQTERLALLFKFVDSEGASAFDQFIRGGAAGLDELQKQLEKTGQIIDEETVDKLSEAGQAIDRITSAAANKFRALTAEILEASGALDKISKIAPPKTGSDRAKSPGFPSFFEGANTVNMLLGLKSKGIDVPDYLIEYLKTGNVPGVKKNSNRSSKKTTTFPAPVPSSVKSSFNDSNDPWGALSMPPRMDAQISAITQNTQALQRLTNIFEVPELPVSITGRYTPFVSTGSNGQYTPSQAFYASFDPSRGPNAFDQARYNNIVINNQIANMESPEMAYRKYMAQSALVPRSS